MQRMVKVPSQALWRINYQELKLLYRVGIGAFGEVFKASFRGTIVAVKRILAKGMKDTEREVLFNRELEFMKYVSGECLSLPHPFASGRFDTQILSFLLGPAFRKTTFA
jgi:serine/threonine protein kinase